MSDWLKSNDIVGLKAAINRLMLHLGQTMLLGNTYVDDLRTHANSSSTMMIHGFF